MGPLRKIRVMITVVILIVLDFAEISEENVAAQCAQFGINDETVNWAEGNNKYPGEKRGYYTIAAAEFDAKWIVSIGARYSYIGYASDAPSTISTQPDGTCPWTFHLLSKNLRIEPCVSNNHVRMNLYLVKQGGRVLQGWLHVEIELLDRSDEIEIVYIQMRDEAFNAIGEFVTADTHPGATCTPSKNYLATPKYYEFFPCSATGLREAKTSAAIMMARKDYYLKRDVVNKKWVHEGSVAKGVHFLWTMGEYWCSRHEKIQPFAYILTRKYRQAFGTPNDRFMLRKVPNYWLRPKWFGAADIIFPHGKLDCRELAIDDNTGVATPNAVNSWFLQKTSKMTLNGDNWHPRNRYSIQGNRLGSNLCQADAMAPSQRKETVPVFSGRCAHHFKKDVSTKNFHGCNLNVNSPEFDAVRPILGQFQSQKAYREKKHADRKAACDPSVKCPAPNTTQDLQNIKQYSIGNITVSNASSKIVIGGNDFRTQGRTHKFWHGRKYHGLLCSVVAFFLTPIYIFVARYFKETFMRRPCYGVAMWYWVHVLGMILSAMLLSSGHSAITPNFPVWGRSEHNAARAHMIIGYFSFVIFGLLIFLGGCRSAPRYEGGGKCLRIVSMTCHALFGFVHYLLNVLAVILSTWIPQSPSLNKCDDTTGLPIGISLIVFVAATLVGIDLLFHIVLTFAQFRIDLGFGIKRRGWWCPLIPLLPWTSISDYAGEKLRKIMLILYILFTLIFAVIVLFVIAEKDLPHNCQSGPMTCKHVFGCTKLAIQYEQWFLCRGGKIDVNYYT